MTIQYRGFLVAKDNEPGDPAYPWMYARINERGPVYWAANLQEVQRQIDRLLEDDLARDLAADAKGEIEG